MTRSEVRLATALAAVSALMLGLRVVATQRVGFGDSEALYAAYALHDQPAYLDHPGFIGLLARAIGGGTAPTPTMAHVYTTIAATLFPLVVAATAHVLGAPLTRAFAAGIAVAVVPEIAIGLFALTPDLPLAFMWVGALGFAGVALSSTPTSSRAAVGFLATGLALGIAASTKVSGATLAIAVVATVASKPGRRHARTIWPYVGLIVAAIVVAPVVFFEARTGATMLHHRLVETQVTAGVSLRNAAAIVVGQLAYLSPVFAVAMVYVASDLLRRRDRDVIDTLLLAAFAAPIALLLPLCLWSRVAEPHWLAPAFLALPIYAARRVGMRTTHAPQAPRALPRLTPGFGRVAVASSLAMVLAVHAWVLIPGLVKLLPASADPRVDIANELYGWPTVTRAVLEALDDAKAQEGPDSNVVVVGPHWVICAQLHAALAENASVGCATPIPDDFDRWLPRPVWQRSDVVIYVTDTRFESHLDTLLPDYAVARSQGLTITRGGRTSRSFRIVTLVRHGST